MSLVVEVSSSTDLCGFCCGARALPVVCSGVSLTALLSGSSGSLLQEERGTVLLSASGRENVAISSFRWGSCSAAAQDETNTLVAYMALSFPPPHSLLTRVTA